MKTVKLNTGVIVTFDDKENTVSVDSPYWCNEKTLSEKQIIKIELFLSFLLLAIFTITVLTLNY